MFRFEELEIWKAAIAYGKHCYQVAEKFPAEERFALADQLRRASVSISNNIAEGSVGSSQNFKRFLIIAVGSALETANILYFAEEMGYIGSEERAALYLEAETLIKRIRSFSNSFAK